MSPLRIVLRSLPTIAGPVKTNYTVFSVEGYWPSAGTRARTASHEPMQRCCISPTPGQLRSFPWDTLGPGERIAFPGGFALGTSTSAELAQRLAQLPQKPAQLQHEEILQVCNLHLLKVLLSITL